MTAKKRKRPTKAQWEAKEFERQIKAEVRADIKAAKEKLYQSVSLDVRRAFIKLCHEKSSKIVDLGKEAGIEDPEAALFIWAKNHKTIKYQVLKDPEEVK